MICLLISGVVIREGTIFTVLLRRFWGWDYVTSVSLPGLHNHSATFSSWLKGKASVASSHVMWCEVDTHSPSLVPRHSPRPLFIFFIWTREEPGNEASYRLGWLLGYGTWLWLWFHNLQFSTHFMLSVASVALVSCLGWGGWTLGTRLWGQMKL